MWGSETNNPFSEADLPFSEADLPFSAADLPSGETGDVYPENWSVGTILIVLGVGALVLALVLRGVINALLFAYTIYTAGLILPVIAGFYKDKLKVTPLGALVAIIGGGAVALVSKIFDIKYLDMAALLIGVVLLFIVSIFQNRVNAKSNASAKILES